MINRGASMTGLPATEELYRLYEIFNARYFAGKLPPAANITITYSNRLTASAGVCYPQRRIIRLSSHYHLKFPDDVESTLLHEMIHFETPQHGADFETRVREILKRGGRVSRHAKERATPALQRWRYSCLKCGRKHPRSRRLKGGGINHRCGRCRGNLREERLE